MSQKCLNDPDNFCYVCGEFTFVSQRREITTKIEKCFQDCFGQPVTNQDKYWVPHICCVSCVRLLSRSSAKSRHVFFATPMIWFEPTNHIDDCYFCCTNTKGITKKNKHTALYAQVTSALRPVRHVPLKPLQNSGNVPELKQVSTKSMCQCKDASLDKDKENRKISPAEEPHLLTKSNLVDLVCELNLNKKQTEVMWCKLNDWNLLTRETKALKLGRP